MTVHALAVERCGDDWDFTGPITDPNGNLLPLVGATASWHLDSLDGKTNYITLTVGSGITINTTTSVVTYGPTAAQTAPLTPGTYYDTFKVTLSNGQQFTVIEGLINALPQPQ